MNNPMSLLEAMILTRHGNVDGSKPRLAAYRAAIVRLRAEAERLMAEVDKAEPAALVHVQVYPGNPGNPAVEGALWVKRTFSDGTMTTTMEHSAFAAQLVYTFEAGKAAGRSGS